MTNGPTTNAAVLGSNLSDETPAAAPPAPNPRRGQKTAAEGMTKRVRIVLSENPDIPPTGLFLGHNGDGFVIVPGEEVEVPEKLLSILDTAVVSVPQVDPQTRQVVAYRDTPKYPYRRV